MLQRNISKKISYLTNHFPAVAILGVRQGGKTYLAKQNFPSWKYFDLENVNDFNLISHDPLFFFTQNSRHIIIDEAQYYPELFASLRGVIDASREENGRFVITGSSSPEILEYISESLAGRIAIVELGTLKANEFYQKSLSPFYEIFAGKIDKNSLDAFVNQDAPLTNEQMQNMWLFGGYPQPILQKDELYYQQWMQNYFDTYVNRDLAKLFPRLNKVKYRQFLTMLGNLSGTIINRHELGRALELSEGAIRDYLTIAAGTYVWRNLPSYTKNTKKALVKMSKGYLRDTGLLHYILRINDSTSLFSHPVVGRSFEIFVIEELLKGLQSTMVTNFDCSYYRTYDGAEIDLILEGTFGMLPIEIKYGVTTLPKQLRTLRQFIDEHNLPLGIVINQAPKAMWLAPKIVQIPVGWL